MAEPLTDQQIDEMLGAIERTAFRLELQPQYQEAAEEDSLERFVAGQLDDPTKIPFIRGWLDTVTRLVAEGKAVERVRIQDDPLTPYQRWERWVGAWNTAAGEKIRYMSRQRAFEVHLLPAAEGADWWLLDDSYVIVMRFDKTGHHISTELETDPATVEQTCAWRDLAVTHSVPAEPKDAVSA